jgi:hypothetical protein
MREVTFFVTTGNGERFKGADGVLARDRRFEPRSLPAESWQRVPYRNSIPCFAHSNCPTLGTTVRSNSKDHWHAALRATGIRPRKFYATRHTFVSIALSKGLNLKFIAEYCGTSVAMIEQHYGRFLADSGESQLDLLGSVSRSVGVLRRRPDRSRKNRDLRGGVSVLRRKSLAK